MKLGIVTDIHDDVVNLRAALDEFERSDVDQVLSLGDAIETFMPDEPGADVCRMLLDADAIGVWGNHDAGASLKPSEGLRQKMDPAVSSFASILEPSIVIEDVRFSHNEHWLNPRHIPDLWYFDGYPTTAEKAARNFAAAEQTYLFSGHFHRWIALTTGGMRDWSGGVELSLDGERHFIVVAPVIEGWCAIFDTDSSLLVPVRCGG